MMSHPRRRRRRLIPEVRSLESRRLLTAVVTSLGQDGHDIVGPDASQGPDGIQDLHLQLTNLSGTVSSRSSVQAPGGFNGRPRRIRPARRWRSISPRSPRARGTCTSTRRSRATCPRRAARCRSAVRPAASIGLADGTPLTVTINYQGGEHARRRHGAGREPGLRDRPHARDAGAGERARDVPGPGPRAGRHRASGTSRGSSTWS